MEALALELNLIKRYRPKYNILLKDDKHFPYIRVRPCPGTTHAWNWCGRQARDGARYFGPYKGATAVREVAGCGAHGLSHPHLQPRLSPEKPQRPCVPPRDRQCLAPCAGLTTREKYHAVLERAMEFLSGKDGPVLAELKERMAEAAKAMNYERAAVYRDRIRAVEDVMQRQKAISTHESDKDVIAVVPEETDAVIQMFFIRSGRLIGSEHYVLEGGGSEPPGEVVLQFILQYYDAENMPPQELLLSAEPPERDVWEQLLSELHGRRTYNLTPLRGEKRKLVAMAQKNARDEAEKTPQKAFPQPRAHRGRGTGIAARAGLDAYPRRIEGYDISNTQGALSVASMVVMIDGASARKEYRHFRIKTVVGANDLRLHARGHHPPPLPRPARAGGQVWRNAGPHPHRRRPRPAFCGAGRHARPRPFHPHVRPRPSALRRSCCRIAKRASSSTGASPALHMIQRLRDEAHRFAITHHRQLRGRHSVRQRAGDHPRRGRQAPPRAADALQKRRSPARSQSRGNRRRARHEPPGSGECVELFCIPAIDSRPGSL